MSKLRATRAAGDCSGDYRRAGGGAGRRRPVRHECAPVPKTARRCWKICACKPILNTAGSGAVDAYVAAAKSEASTRRARAAAACRRARSGGKAEEEARAKAEELGIGAVDLSEIDTQPMSAGA